MERFTQTEDKEHDMNRRGFFARTIVAVGAMLGIKSKPDPSCGGFLYSKAGAGKWMGSSSKGKGIFLGDARVESSKSVFISYSYQDKESGRLVHVMSDGRRCVV